MAMSRKEREQAMAAAMAKLPPNGVVGDVTTLALPSTGGQVPIRYQVKGVVNYAADQLKGVGPKSAFVTNGTLRSEIEKRVFEKDARPLPVWSADPSGYPMIDGVLVPTPYSNGVNPFDPNQ